MSWRIGAALLVLLVPPAAADGLRLQVTVGEKPILQGSPLNATVALENEGERSLMLVTPGDGSRHGRRTPVFSWSVLPARPESAAHPEEPPRGDDLLCGNINALKRGEVFTLPPGGRRVLSEVTAPTLDEPGTFRILFYYENHPNASFAGIPLGVHDAEEMRALRASDAVAVVSNEVTVQVQPISAAEVASLLLSEDSSSRTRGERSARFVGRDVLEPLHDVLERGSEGRRVLACGALGSLAEASWAKQELLERDVHELVEDLSRAAEQDPSPAVRDAAARALWPAKRLAIHRMD